MYQIMNRYSHIDMARGIAMVLVVAGHSCFSTEGDLNRMILSFHMPLFFFLSGIFAKKYSFGVMLGGVKNKILKILVPQLLLAVLVMVLKIAPILRKGESLTGFNWIGGLFYWFLPTLFICSVLYMFLSCFIEIEHRCTQILVLLATLISVCSTLYTLELSEDILVTYIRIVPVAFLFYLLGSVFKERVLSQEVENRSITEVVLLLAAPILFIVSQWNTPVKMYQGDYGCFPLFLITSILGIFVVVELIKRIKSFNILIEMGQMSIAIYVWNFLVVGFTKFMLLRTLKMLGFYTSGAHAALTFLISIILLYFISKMTIKFTPWFYGIKK